MVDGVKTGGITIDEVTTGGMRGLLLRREVALARPNLQVFLDG
jgi:hypothetical protein